jgi:hypothetical protein
MSTISFSHRIIQLETKIDNLNREIAAPDHQGLREKVRNLFAEVNQSSEDLSRNWDNAEAVKSEISEEMCRVLSKLVILNKILTERKLI